MVGTLQQKVEWYPKLKEMIETFGDWTIRLADLKVFSKKSGVGIATLYRWKKEAIKEIGIIDIRRAGRNIYSALGRTIQRLQREMEATDDRRELAILVRALTEVTKAFTDCAEKYGIKEVVITEMALTNIQGDYTSKVLQVLNIAVPKETMEEKGDVKDDGIGLETDKIDPKLFKQDL